PGCPTSNIVMCKTCDIRLCNLSKQINSCSKCQSYPCEKIDKLSIKSVEMLNNLHKKYFKKG
ncbi:MAG: DUF3795 domain-containing protein, partial [Bacilli bacterium]|nr:DUF3795 domain-containing protein [Bacilli bacterium]